jgi:hypothetical protein
MRIVEKRLKQFFDWMLFVLCGTVASAQSLPSIVESTNHGDGWYSYTFRRGELPYVWGCGDIWLTFPGAVDVESPPNWTYTIKDEFIVWTVTNGVVFLEEPIIFRARTLLPDSRIYSGASPIYGFIGGGIYSLPDHLPFTGGYQAFDFVGPTLPLLRIEQSGTNIIVRWTGQAGGMQLKGSDRLGMAALWGSVTNDVAVVDSESAVTIPIESAQKFFRLALP